MNENSTEELLTQRNATHGSFALNAEISQRLKDLYDHYDPQRTLSNVHREALDVIALKISRIMSGQSLFADHWDDIAGYAKLASRACAPVVQTDTKPGGVTVVSSAELINRLGK